MSRETELFDEFIENDDPLNALTEDEFPCEQCGSLQKFSPQTQNLRCDHCHHTTQIVAADAVDDEQSLQHAIQIKRANHATVQIEESVKCRTCAAEFAFEEHEHASECPYCGSGVVRETAKHLLTKPNAVVPFAITEKEAHDRLSHWLKRLWFAPNKVKRFARNAEGLRGVYMPYWTYDSDTHSSYRGKRGDTYYVNQTVTVMVDGRPTQQVRRVPKVRWTPVSGNVWRDFNDVLVSGSQSLPRKLLKSLDQWDLFAAKEMKPDFIAGFRSESYQIDVEEGFSLANSIMEQVVRSDVRRDIGGDHQQIDWVRTEHDNQSFKHVLLPLWISAFRYGRKSYRYAVNGQSGAVVGERPYSWVKIAIALLCFVVLFILVVTFVLSGMENGSNTQIWNY